VPECDLVGVVAPTGKRGPEAFDHLAVAGGLDPDVERPHRVVEGCRGYAQRDATRQGDEVRLHRAPPRRRNTEPKRIATCVGRGASSGNSTASAGHSATLSIRSPLFVIGGSASAASEGVSTRTPAALATFCVHLLREGHPRLPPFCEPHCLRYTTVFPKRSAAKTSVTPKRLSAAPTMRMPRGLSAECKPWQRRRRAPSSR
jgi:hypothetical protein